MLACNCATRTDNIHSTDLRKGKALIPVTLLKQVKSLSRAQKLRLMQILADELGEQDWVYRAYTPDGDGRAAQVLQEMLDSAKAAEQPTLT